MSLLSRIPRVFSNHNLHTILVNSLGRNFSDRSKNLKAKYGGRHTVTMLPGHGIGPELMVHVREVFRYAGVPVDFEEINLHTDVDDISELNEAITSVKRNGVALKANIETRTNSPAFKSRNVEFRLQLDLFANVLHCKSFPGIKTRHENIDLVIIRQNTEGEYSCLEHEGVKGIVESLKVITRDQSERIASYAFEYARRQGRKKVTAIHKANIMKLADGLFLRTCEEISKDYPEIQFENMIIDNCSMQLVSKPSQFDVMLMPNLYGNILSNIACGLVGGPGLVSGRNFGENFAVFETGTRNTGKQIAGKNIANPIGILNASVDMLTYLGLDKHATILSNAIHETINVDMVHTPDLGGQATTTDVIQSIVNKVQRESSKQLRI